jgi:hypothetical protein
MSEEKLKELTRFDPCIEREPYASHDHASMEVFKHGEWVKYSDVKEQWNTRQSSGAVKWVYSDDINTKLSTEDALNYLVKMLDRENGANFYKRYINNRLAKDFACDLVKVMQANILTQPNG